MDGMTCQVGTDNQGLIDVTYAADGTVTLRCVATKLATLTVAPTGGGSGKVTSAPAGIDCGTTCTAAYPLGTGVTLTATAAPGSMFTGWSTCTGTGPCAVTLDADRTVAPTFVLTTTVRLTLATANDDPLSTFGTNTVHGPNGYTCTVTGFTQKVCDPFVVPAASVVTLFAQTGGDDRVLSWSGPCATAGRSNQCTFTTTAGTTDITLTFSDV
jgi:hypothetical protein